MRPVLPNLEDTGLDNDVMHVTAGDDGKADGTTVAVDVVGRCFMRLRYSSNDICGRKMNNQ